LERHPRASLRVYAIWAAKYGFDSRDQWDGGGLTDRRVVHLWDGPDIAGDWFVAHEAGFRGNDWDTYLLFGPSARWTTQPGPLIGSGSPVIDQADALARSIAPLLQASGGRRTA
jgi:hypothetical protein